MRLSLPSQQGRGNVRVGKILRGLGLLLYTTGVLFGANAQPAAPTNFSVIGYDSHLELSWNASSSPNVFSYNIYRATMPDGPFALFRQTSADRRYALDFTGRRDTTFYYRVTAVNAIGQEGAPSVVRSGSTAAMSDEDLLTMVQRYTFRYFWDYGHPVSGLARERFNSGDLVTVGGSGFGIMAIVVGAARGFVTREEAVLRLIQITSFLEIRAQRYHGAFAHWMNGATGATIPFSQFDDGGDLVETALLMQGLLAARGYFNANTPLENALRASITRLWEGVEWSWYRRNNSNVLYWHWSPNYQWQMNFQLRGFNEVMIAYILGVASPTHGIPPHLYHVGWANNGAIVNPASYYGIPMLAGPFRGGPLFFAHYSYLGFDPRNKRDAYCNYFTRNRNHTLINRAYCVANPKNYAGYGPNCWGLTASDNPWGYLAHEPVFDRDNGTIAPTAALSSMPYTPAESIEALKHFYRNLGQRLWGWYGFYDAFNIQEDWVSSYWLAIDQGPIIAMIENYRTGLLWDAFMSNPEIQPALNAIGFVPEVNSAREAPDFPVQVTIAPNPVQSAEFQLLLFSERTLPMELSLRDINGRLLQALGRHNLQPGENTLPLRLPSTLPNGMYLLECRAEGLRHVERIAVHYHN